MNLEERTANCKIHELLGNCVHEAEWKHPGDQFFPAYICDKCGAKGFETAEYRISEKFLNDPEVWHKDWLVMYKPPNYLWDYNHTMRILERFPNEATVSFDGAQFVVTPKGWFRRKGRRKKAITLATALCNWLMSRD